MLNKHWITSVCNIQHFRKLKFIVSWTTYVLTLLHWVSLFSIKRNNNTSETFLDTPCIYVSTVELCSTSSQYSNINEGTRYCEQHVELKHITGSFRIFQELLYIWEIKTVSSFKLHFLQNNPLLQFYTSDSESASSYKIRLYSNVFRWRPPASSVEVHSVKKKSQ